MANNLKHAASPPAAGPTELSPQERNQLEEYPPTHSSLLCVLTCVQTSQVPSRWTQRVARPHRQCQGGIPKAPDRKQAASRMDWQLDTAECQSQTSIIDMILNSTSPIYVNALIPTQTLRVFEIMLDRLAAARNESIIYVSMERKVHVSCQVHHIYI
jgi:hypothetical protein